MATIHTAATLDPPSRTQTGNGFSIFIPKVANQDYVVVLAAPHSGVITEVSTESASGTCTIAPKVNAIALGGGANSVSTSKQTVSHAINNAFAAGDRIVLTASGNTSCLGLSATVKYTRELE